MNNQGLKFFSTIAKVHRSFVRELNKKFADKGMNYLDFLILRAVMEKESTMSELAKRYYVTQATITASVDRLEQKGYVERKRDLIDRRVVTVKITKKGEETFKDLLKDYSSLADEVIKNIKVDDTIEILQKILNKLDILSSKS
ncbi:MarR family winged helix-turn-helix transcriptional regulator [Stygiolobus caldivivus]|uniref:MarR family transcriptional regulator n=1 Tax=Stygiolobus caldivivus TaxID=2824673 RepID=A0A8D5U6B5_9CREN|nr:MarR family transcriptional regulator [Stygiolobus caldivivus]BCU70331.1 MarR family transcriptional regulator [Stygiolobus caldivivus]